MPASNVLNSELGHSESRGTRPDSGTTPVPSSRLSIGAHRIVRMVPGHLDCESDDAMPGGIPEIPLNNRVLTLAHKAGLIKK
jgi:hypothetical protein